MSDAKYPAGKIGLSANVPARYQDVLVEVSPEVKQDISKRIYERNAAAGQAAGGKSETAVVAEVFCGWLWRRKQLPIRRSGW